MLRYEEYKDSGAAWLGCIPSHWKIGVIGSLYTMRNTKVSDTEYPPLSVTMRGVVPQLETAAKTDAHDARKLVMKGDFAINSRSDRRGSCGISDYNGSVSLINTVLTPRGKMNPQYYNWLFRTVQFADEYYKNGHGIVDDLWTTRWNEMKRILIPVPSLDEQARIAAYLTNRIVHVDSIIAEAKASIEEYKRWKQAIIDEAILGYDDIHIKLRQLGTLKNGINFSHSEATPNIKFLGVGCFKDSMVLDSIDNFADEHIDFTVGDDYLLHDGDIVFVRSNGSKELVGRSVLIDNITYPLTFSGFCIRFRNMRQALIDNRFLLYYFRTSYFKQNLLKYSNDSTNINNLNQEMLNAIHINAPQKEVQLQIIEILTRKIEDIDSTIREKEVLLTDLEAYKKSLIFEVVTGKRRVC